MKDAITTPTTDHQDAAMPSVAVAASAAMEQARQHLDARVAIIGQIEVADAHVAAAKEALKAAEVEHTKVWASALKIGWSEEELKGFGLTSPNVRPAGRRRANVKRRSADA